MQFEIQKQIETFYLIDLEYKIDYETDAIILQVHSVNYQL